VLFADLAGFTELSERADAEDVRAFQNDLFRALSAEVARFDGFVEKFVGDAVMAVFGAPVAHEDDPERALRAALAMRDRMRTLSQRWEPRFGAPVALHIGVNTGPVVAGSLDTAAGGAYAVTGDTVNTAARLLAAATAGTVLVSAATHRLTRDAFTFEPLSPLSLKGKAEPLAVYRLLGLLDTPPAARGLATLGLTAPFVGRDDELRQMDAAFERVRRGRAEAVSLVGEAGVGKSRLIAEFLFRLAREDALATTTVRHVVCSSLGEQTYGVFAAMFREAYQVAPGDGLEVAQRKFLEGLQALGAGEHEARAVAPLLGYVLGLDLPHAVNPVEPEQLQRQIVLAARMLTERRLQQGPLVLVVENLQWADTASVDLLRSLVDRLSDRALMLVASYRPPFDATALVSSRTTHTAIRLAPLTAAETERLLVGFFGASVRTLPARLRTLIVTRAGGNPLYVEEVVRGLVAQGVLVRDGDGWRCAGDDAALDVPPTIQGLLLSRLDRLAAAARRVIQGAAVLGPVFDLELLREVAGEPGPLDATLELLRDAELVEEVGRGAGARRYRFSHALFQEVVYQNLLVSRRTELHERAGRALERACGAGPERLEDLEALGHHFSLSPDKLKGARYLRTAGDWAGAVYANDDAVRHYERALKTLRECDAPARETLAVRERLGDLLGPTGRREPSVEHYEAVRAAYAAAGEWPEQARLCRKLGGLYWDAGDRPRALGCFEEGLQLLEGHAEHIELAHLYQEMGRLAFRSGENDRAIDWAERALAAADRLRSAAHANDADERREAAAVTAHAYNTLGIALARTGRLDEAVAHVERSVEIAHAHELLQIACRGYTNLGVLYSTLDPQRSITTCLRGIETAKKIGDLGVQSRLYANLAVAYCALTDQCEAEGIEAAQSSIELDRRLGQLDHLAIPLIVLGQIYQCHGQPGLAMRYYREALSLAEAAGEPQLLFPCYDGLATLYLDLGDEAQAEQYMMEAKRVCERAGLDPDSFVVLPFLG
jgi:adenylate cyclase